MGVDYKAKTIVAVRITATDFVERREVLHVRCAHPEADAPGVKFCPMCGIHTSKRTSKHLREFPLPAVAHLDLFAQDGPVPEGGFDEGFFEDWLRQSSDYDRIGPFNVIDLNDRESLTHAWVLGFEFLSSGSSYGSTSYRSVPAHTMEDTIAQVRDGVAALGIKDRPVEIICQLYVC